MGSHIVDGKFKSDKFPECPAGLVPLSPSDPMAQDLLWEYAERRRKKDEEFSADLQVCLHAEGYRPGPGRLVRVRVQYAESADAERDAAGHANDDPVWCR